MEKANTSIFAEVEEYLDLGIHVTLNEKDIFEYEKGIHAIKEDSSYMRDYISDEQGVLNTINFTDIGSSL